MITVGLRIDVDTLRGTREGVPALVKILKKHDITATFFMSVGPDNMGRNLWRLLKPQFLWKMLRSNGASLYGYDILLRGTAWPGPVIGHHCAQEIRLPKKAGHEVGLHAWDHFTWQASIDRMTPARMENHLRWGFDKLAAILGEAPTCSAAAGWRCNEQALELKEPFGFAYNSDCRGVSAFTPMVSGKALTVQIPVTLPTYDEAIGQNGISDDNYNEHILGLCKPDALNVYTIHAEVEGGAKSEMFEQFLKSAGERGIEFKPLRDLLPKKPPSEGQMIKQDFPGREGWIAVQA